VSPISGELKYLKLRNLHTHHSLPTVSGSSGNVFSGCIGSLEELIAI
jgi:hypothetical protein